MLEKRIIPLFAFAPFALLAQPINNPVLDTFPTSGPVINGHTFGDYSWSDDLKWGTVTTTQANGSDLPPNHPDATAIDIAGSAADDLATVQAEIDTIHNAGGGVLYFPAGDYFFSDDLVLKDGVIIRGADPVAQADARQMDYDPLTNFWFPKVPHIIADANVPENGRLLDTANATFASKEELLSVNKVIQTEAPLFDSNLGVVNIDIQRARIDILQRDDSVDGTPGDEFDDFAHYYGTNAKNRLENTNIVIFGNRINNATAFDPRVPFHLSAGRGMNRWQRWMNRNNAKIDVMAHENVVIANNRIGDFHYNYLHADTANKANWLIDDFGMPARGTDLTNTERYLQSYPGGGAPGTGIPIDAVVFPGVIDSDFGYLIYRYNQGNGIVLNLSSQTGYQNMNHPAAEPSIYKRNMAVRQNWIHVRDGGGIQGSGNGLEFRDNVRTDFGGRQVWMNRQGGSIQNGNSAIYENRGFAFAGVNVLIDNNDFNVQRPAIRGGPYLTIDGEGIEVNARNAGYIENVTITNNISREGWIAIWKIRYGRDINISNNQMLGNDPILADFNSNTRAGGVYGLAIGGNTASDITFEAQTLPADVVVTNNTVSGDINLSDYGIENSTVYTVSGNNKAPNYTLHNGNSFQLENKLDLPPQIKILEPMHGDIFLPGQEISVRAQVTVDPNGSTPIKTVRFYDGTVNGPNEKPNGGSEWTSDQMNTNFNAYSTVTLTLTEPDPNDLLGLGSGVYTGAWTVPTGIGYANLFAEARSQSVTIRSSDAGGTLTYLPFANRTWAFLEMAAVDPGNDEPIGYRAYIEGHSDIPSGMDGMMEDPDKDGLINLLEYAFGTVADVANVLDAPIVEDISGTDYISVTFDKAANDVNYNPLYTDSMSGSFMDASSAPGVLVDEDASMIKISIPLDGVAGFARLEIVVP
jgi:hypothetical protein